MTERNDHYRSRYRMSRSRPRREEKDAIVAALSVQIVVCLMLLLAANLVKRADEERFSGMKAEYEHLVGSEQQSELLGTYFDKIEGMSRGFFGTVESLIEQVFSGFAGESAALRTQGEESAAGEPVARTLSAGAGGLGPVASSLPAGEYLSAPQGNSLAPVYLAGHVIPPVSGAITSAFAYRYHPITDEVDFHTGIDIAAEEGRGVLAALPGEVAEVGWSDIYGNYILLQHATNLQTFYAHCSEIIAAQGMKIRQGERIAKVGQTGVATGPHLHFSVIVDGLNTDPAYVLEEYLQVLES